MKKKILIVGGTGFIGFHLARKCLMKGWSVTSVSKKKPKKIRLLKKIKYLHFNICSKKQVNQKLKKQTFDYIVNCGGNVDHRNKLRVYLNHYIGCKNLVDYFKKKKIKSFIQLGSSVEYGNLKSPQTEYKFKYNKSSTNSYYGDAKLKATKYLLSQYKINKFPSKILRIYLAYGPKQDLNRFIPIVINACIKNKKFNCSNAKQYRDFIFIDDLINLILKSLSTHKYNGEIFNAGTGKPQNLKKIIFLIQKLCKGGQPLFGKIKLRKDEIMKIYPSNKKTQNKLKWKPKYNFIKGIKKTILYYKKNARFG